jgi:hypothetical protein
VADFKRKGPIDVEVEVRIARTHSEDRLTPAVTV